MSARIGDSRLVFGVTDEVWGYIQNLKIDNTSQKMEAKNGQGNTIAVEYFNAGEKSVSGSFFYIGSDSSPDAHVGDGQSVTLTDASGVIYIEKASEARSVGNWKVIDFEGTQYPHLVNS